MRWINNLPNKLISEITPNIGICLKHWPIGYRTVKVQGSNCKPADPPSIFGLPNSITPQSSKTIAREIDKRGVSSETRQKTSARLDQKKDTISCWNDLVKYCRSLPVVFQDVKESIRLVKLDDSIVSVEYSLVIGNELQVSANKGSKMIPVRHLLNSPSHKLTQYGQLKNILDYLNKIPLNLASELEPSGKRMLELYNLGDTSDVDLVKEKQMKFSCNQMILLHAKGPNGYRYDRECVLEEINVFLRSRCAYKPLRDILILPSQKDLRSYSGKLGSHGSFNESKKVIDRIFLKLDDNKKTVLYRQMKFT